MKMNSILCIILGKIHKLCNKMKGNKFHKKKKTKKKLF